MTLRNFPHLSEHRASFQMVRQTGCWYINCLVRFGRRVLGYTGSEPKIAPRLGNQARRTALKCSRATGSGSRARTGRSRDTGDSWLRAWLCLYYQRTPVKERNCWCVVYKTHSHYIQITVTYNWPFSIYVALHSRSDILLRELSSVSVTNTKYMYVCTS